MKRSIAITLVSLLVLTSAYAVDPLIISNNAYVGIGMDSLIIADELGYRFPIYWQDIQTCLHPDKVVYVYVPGGSGSSMDKFLTNDLPSSVGFFGYQSNNFQHILFFNQTDNIGLTSNAMRLACSNVCQFPVKASVGDLPLQTSFGWMAGQTFQIVPIGHPPGGSDGSPASGQLSGAGYSAGQTFGLMGVDSWVDLVLRWTNDVVVNNGTNIQTTPNGHILDGGDWDWVCDVHQKTQPSDTNVANSMVDYTTGAVVWTNNCVAYSITKSANSISVARLDNAVCPIFFIADGGLITNNCLGLLLNPALANYFDFGFGVTNLPNGNYDVAIDGTTVGTISSSTLASPRGWNMFTNYVGPLFTQRTNVLRRIVDWYYLNPTTFASKSAGDGVGAVSVGSTSFSGWVSGNRGDSQIAFLNSKMTQIQTNYLPQYSQSIYAAVQPSAHTFTVTLVGANSYKPAPFR